MDEHVAQSARRQLALGRVQIRSRQAEAETALQRVGGTAGQHDQAGANRRARGVCANLVACEFQGADPRVETNFRTGRLCLSGEPLVEPGAVDDDGLKGWWRVPDLKAGRRDELDGFQRVENGLSRKGELVEADGAQHARTVDRSTDCRVFLAHQRRKSGLSEAPRGVQPRGPPADDQHVETHSRDIIASLRGSLVDVSSAAADRGAPIRLGP